MKYFINAFRNSLPLFSAGSEIVCDVDVKKPISIMAGDLRISAIVGRKLVGKQGDSPRSV